METMSTKMLFFMGTKQLRVFHTLNNNYAKVLTTFSPQHYYFMLTYNSEV